MKRERDEEDVVVTKPQPMNIPRKRHESDSASTDDAWLSDVPTFEKLSSLNLQGQRGLLRPKDIQEGLGEEHAQYRSVLPNKSPSPDKRSVAARNAEANKFKKKEWDDYLGEQFNYKFNQAWDPTYAATEDKREVLEETRRRHDDNFSKGRKARFRGGDVARPTSLDFVNKYYNGNPRTWRYRQMPEGRDG